MNTESTKEYYASKVLSSGATLRVLIDSTKTKVVVPSHLLNRPNLCLEVGRKMPIPIPDLTVTPRGFFGTLSFNGIFCYVNIPWEAVYLLKDTGTGHQLIWEEDVPVEALKAILAKEQGLAPVISLAEYRKKKGK